MPHPPPYASDPRFAFRLALCLALGPLFGCRSPTAHRQEADASAYRIISEAQSRALGRSEPFTIERPSDTLRRRLLLDQSLPIADDSSLGAQEVELIVEWPDPDYGRSGEGADDAPESSAPVPFPVGFFDALRIAARGSAEYQEQKEAVFSAALKLDLERDAFRNTWTGRLKSLLSTDGGGSEQVSGAEAGGRLGLTRAFKAGGAFALDLGVDLAKLLTQDKSSSYGLLADATVTMPLLRGAGRFVVQEPLTQAERDVVYAIQGFELYKQRFAVQVASEYLGVLQQMDQVQNARDNYQRLIQSTRRARRIADAGQMPETQVDQALQDELRAKNRFISAVAAYEQSLDEFKEILGLPADALIELDRSALASLAESSSKLIAPSGPAPAPSAPPGDPPAAAEAYSVKGPLELPAEQAVRLALRNRYDLRTAVGRVHDAQRSVVVAADALRADLELLGKGSAGGSRSVGNAGSGDARLDVGDGRYSAGLNFDIPLERSSERNRYRSSLIDFERSVRAVQALEDQIKRSIRSALRGLRESRESVAIQARAVEVARRRMESTGMFMEAGRAQIRDVLEAEESLVSAQNALTSALVRYRVQELELQREMGLLRVDSDGNWIEFDPSHLYAEESP